MYRILHADASPHRRHVVHLSRCTTSPTASRDSIEGITHSLCTLEFEDHRPLYDWFLDQLGIYHPQQIEFARLNLTYTVMSKRKLLQLVKDGYVQRLGRSAHADPLPACAAAATRPRPSATSASAIGVAKSDSTVDIALLEHCVREDLNKRAPARHGGAAAAEGRHRRTIPRARSRSSRPSTTPRTRPRARGRCRSRACSTSSRTTSAKSRRQKYFRLVARAAKCGCATPTSSSATGRGQGCRDRRGDRTALHLRPGHPRRRRRRTAARSRPRIHWVSAAHAMPAEVAALRPALQPIRRIRTRARTSCHDLNPDSLEVLEPCWSSRALPTAEPGDRYQFERLGYFCVDPDSQLMGKAGL